jgi:hypothetical protein
MATESRAAEIKGQNLFSDRIHRYLTYLFPPAKLQERDDHVRESWVKAMEVRLVREELEKCQQGEGVNHYENCRWLADKYTTMLRENRVRS